MSSDRQAGAELAIAAPIHLADAPATTTSLLYRCHRSVSPLEEGSNAHAEKRTIAPVSDGAWIAQETSWRERRGPFYTAGVGWDHLAGDRVVRCPTFIISSVRSTGIPRANGSGLWLAAIMALAACTIDDRPIAPNDDDVGDSAEVAGAGGAMTASMPPVQMQTGTVDPDDGAEGAPNPTGMLAGGGAGNVGTPTAPSEPAPEPTMPMPPVATPLTINGRVVDEGLRPVPDLPVTIGGTTVTTGAAGEFTIGGVLPPYDASLRVTQRQGRTVGYGYVFEGLTRPDPTLQVSGGLPGQSANVSIAVQNADFSNTLREAIIGYATPDRAFSTTITSDPGIADLTSWTGPATTGGTAHGLLVVRGGTGQASDPIVAYEAHRTTTLALSTGVATALLLDMSANQVATSTIGGSVSVSGSNEDRANHVSLRFNDGVELPLVEDEAPAGTFSYLVPALPGASLRVSASEGSVFPFRGAHRENIAPGQTGVNIPIPNAVSLTSPANGATIAADQAQFSWSAAGQTATTFVFHVEFADTVEGIFIITNRTTVTIPTFADGFTVVPGTSVNWSVETHGEYADVNAATGPNGFIDALAYWRGTTPLRPELSDGYYTGTEQRFFTAE
jgi:hypothetical protein